MSPRRAMVGGVVFVILLMIVFALMNRGSSGDEPPSEIMDVSITAKKI